LLLYVAFEFAFSESNVEVDMMDGLGIEVAVAGGAAICLR